MIPEHLTPQLQFAVLAFSFLLTLSSAPLFAAPVTAQPGLGAPEGESSAGIRGRVLGARARQRERLGGAGIFSNASMTPRLIRRHCRLGAEGERLLEAAMTRLGLSARAYDRILKVSRTIADLEGHEEIQPAHVAEAVGYRSLDRTYWT